MDAYLSAQEAANILDVSKPTLYAYVSRGMVRSIPGKDSRSRLYNRLDVDQLKARKRIRSKPQIEVPGTLNWGAPVLDSTLTLIINQNLYYRGVNVKELALNHDFWEVACWFWNGSWGSPYFASGSADPPDNREPLLALQSWLIQLSSRDPAGYLLQFPALGSTGVTIVRQFLANLCRRQNAQPHRAALELQECWCRDLAGARRILNAALILSLDHELNVSSFAGRVVASAGSSIYEIVNAAICAFSGSRHGRATIRAEKLLRHLLAGSSNRSAIREVVQFESEVPGFGHSAYPDGDPRARLIFELLSENNSSRYAKVRRIVTKLERMLHRFANLDMALAAATVVLGLPVQAGFYIFGLGRLVGWIAHAAEQAASKTLLRPRARYVGVMPEIAGHR
jgi:citrate synthase